MSGHDRQASEVLFDSQTAARLHCGLANRMAVSSSGASTQTVMRSWFSGVPKGCSLEGLPVVHWNDRASAWFHASQPCAPHRDPGHPEIISVATAGRPHRSCGFSCKAGGCAGLVLFPGDGDNSSPDVSWSYSGFAAFRRRLAQSAGFALSEMWGFGGDRPWSEVSTVLEPLLNHPDDGGDDLTPADCAVVLPRLQRSPMGGHKKATTTHSATRTPRTPGGWPASCGSASTGASRCSFSEVGAASGTH